MSMRVVPKRIYVGQQCRKGESIGMSWNILSEVIKDRPIVSIVGPFVKTILAFSMNKYSYLVYVYILLESRCTLYVGMTQTRLSRNTFIKTSKKALQIDCMKQEVTSEFLYWACCCAEKKAYVKDSRWKYVII